MATARVLRREPGAAGAWREYLAGAVARAELCLPEGADAAAARAAGALLAARWAGRARVALDARGLARERALDLAEGASLRAWRMPAQRRDADPDAPRLARLDLVLDAPAAASAEWAARAAALRGAAFARDLVAEPANSLTPMTLAGRMGALAAHGVAVEVLDARALRRLRLGALLAVGGGAAHPPCLAVLRWPGGPGTRNGARPIAFIGKGITFDTGGLCIKPAERMWDMRADMAGAAACAGAMLALALRRAPVPAVAVLALAENTTGAASYRPSDILTMHDGRTVEVVDTDAEGRLVLADALAYAARRFRPRALVDVATLTGAIVVALGRHMAGLFANDDALAALVREAGAAVGERVWRMPIGEGHVADLESGIADLRQCASGRFLPDACHAAAFLRAFAGAVPWAHLDIAGVEAVEEADDAHAAGPTGFGARLLDELTRRLGAAA